MMNAVGNASMPTMTTSVGGTTGPMIGLVVPGGPVRTDWVPVDASGTKFSLTLSSPGDLPYPITVVNELVVFLLPQSPLPPTHGILLYWQVHVVGGGGGGETGFEVLGCLTPTIPSAILRTGWSEHEQLVSIVGATGGNNNIAAQSTGVSVTIGISIEPLANVENIVSNGNTSSNAVTARRPLVAQRIAQDLFNFMSSFDTGAGGGSNPMMVVPKSVFERWWTRFESKSKRDPNFFLKQQD